MSASSTLIHQPDIVGYGREALIFLVLGLILLIAVRLSRWAIALRTFIRSPSVYLEVTPPAHRDKSPLATEQLFIILHGLKSSRSWRAKVLRPRPSLSLEVVSSLDSGIRYLIRVAKKDVMAVRQSINSYCPDAKIAVVQDYLPAELGDRQKFRLSDYRQSGHFAYPLANHSTLDEHDPIAYLTGSMTKLRPGEMMAFQVVISASKQPAKRLKKQILAGKDTQAVLGRRRHASAVLKLLWLSLRLPLFLANAFIHSFILVGPSRPHTYSRGASPKPLSYVQRLLVDSVQTKLNLPLFKASIRTLVIADSRQHCRQRDEALASSLTSFDLPGYQSLKARANFPSWVSAKYRLFCFRYRLPGLFPGRPLILSAVECAGLYHFPNSVGSRTENVVKSLSRSLPAPISLKGPTKLDIILGVNQHQGSSTPIGLTAAERQHHVYIVGGTGSGKSTMLLGSIIQDISRGKGLAVIDPHGDLSETILRHIPKSRMKDVIYFNPDDLDHPVGLNLLELTPGLSGNELRREKDMVTEAVVSVFRKIFSDDNSGGHRIEYVLRNSVHTALTLKDATLFTVYRLLTDPVYKNRVVSGLEDGNLKNFWRNEFGMAGAYQKVKMIHGITSKIGRFERSASAQPILSQPHSTIDFDEILDSGKILVCNLSRGLLGEDTSTLFGTTILAKLQMAALRRARLQPSARRAFYLYVDEFQNFATSAFVQMLSEARKYGLFLSMAEQSTAQQEEQRLVNIILANVGTVIAFRSGSPTDERLILPLFRPYIGAGEIASLPAYNFYARVSAVKPQEPLSGKTTLPESEGSQATAEQVIQLSRLNYAGKNIAGDKTSGPKPQKTIPKVYKVPSKLDLASGKG